MSTPLTWDEVADATKAADLRFTAADVVSRVEEFGDLLADMPDNARRTPLIELRAPAMPCPQVTRSRLG